MNKFEFCRKVIRDIPTCKQCIHYSECKAFGKPASKLANFVFTLREVKMPVLKNTLNDICQRQIGLTDSSPFEEEEENGAVWVLTLTAKSRRVRIPLYGDEKDFLSLCLGAYVSIINKEAEERRSLAIKNGRWKK